ncbi:Sulfite exporter TauE/SafE [Aureliella helgolandensis]|uniref:Probable membrane transporter protein n=2 Tax=Aureliella helgolandensis TaxID=2527968 RepID=A0A518GA51_9BACT|nr:Sulfite exporter TauE/SafE [Aureliella helgolandensis]
MGGGTVGFPVLVLFFDLPGSLGRNFALAVQAIGMVSASIYIFAARRPVDWDILRPAIAGAILGMPLGAVWIAPYVPDLWVKLTFAVVWCSFGVLHLLKLKELIAAQGTRVRNPQPLRRIGFSIGLLGGVVAAVTGVGIDMIVYATLVLLYRSDLKVAIPTSVVIMAFTSLLGISTNYLLATAFPAHFSIAPEVFANWLAAAPVVALGAPIGSIVVNLISRAPTLILVSILCIGQFLWTLIDEQVSGLTLLVALGGVLIVNAVFQLLYRVGSDHPSPVDAVEPTSCAIGHQSS